MSESRSGEKRTKRKSDHGLRLTGPLAATALRASANTALRAASPVAGTLCESCGRERLGSPTPSFHVSFMFASCIYCHSRFGSNVRIENMPIGRRLAYDVDRGRMWVICGRCGYWNLTPLEERWEALEECERLYENAARVVSTDEVSLVELAGGPDLVRVGSPTRSEFIAWRYARRFGSRRKARNLKIASGALAAGALAIGGATAGLPLGVVLYGYLYWGVLAVGSRSEEVTRLPRDNAEPIALWRNQLRAIGLYQPSRGPWMLRDVNGWANMSGPEAVMGLGLVLPIVNRFGASSKQVKTAVQLLGDSDPRRFFADAAMHRTNLGLLPRPVRLALEMAAHEDAEREAAEGELGLLLEAWKEAEELAAIADSLLIPPQVHEVWTRMKSRMDPG